MEESRDLRVALGPVGLAGITGLLLGVLTRSRLLALIGLSGVIADVTVAELGGFKSMNEARLSPALTHARRLR